MKVARYAKITVPFIRIYIKGIFMFLQIKFHISSIPSSYLKKFFIFFWKVDSCFFFFLLIWPI